jgi:bacillithiol system protein YtxJ
MNDWKSIHSDDELSEAILVSNAQPVLLFKHSTRCGISSMAKRRLENLDPSIVDVYMIDVISNRSISNRIAEMFDIRHESPQAILLIDGEVIWSGSHGKVQAETIELKINESNLEQS